MTDNEALAESIRNYLESGVDLLLTDDDYRTIIKALEQEQKTGQIPVSERLPEADGIRYKADGVWYKASGGRVKAWMQLPGPYKGSEG